MNDRGYSRITITEAAPGQSCDAISRVAEWWAKDFQGQSKRPGDVFTVRFEKGDSFKLKVAEVIPDRRIVWEVLDANQKWVKDPAEWVGTKIIWDINEVSGGTEIRFTHLGLVPDLECFGTCQLAWDYLMQKSLAGLLSTGTGLPA